MTFLHNKHGNPCFRLDPDPLLDTLRFNSFYAIPRTPFWLGHDDPALQEASKCSLVRFNKSRRYLCVPDFFPNALHDHARPAEVSRSGP